MSFLCRLYVDRMSTGLCLGGPGTVRPNRQFLLYVSSDTRVREIGTDSVFVYLCFAMASNRSDAAVSDSDSSTAPTVIEDGHRGPISIVTMPQPHHLLTPGFQCDVSLCLWSPRG